MNATYPCSERSQSQSSRVREPDIYGSETLADVEASLVAWGKDNGVSFELRQSNHEGDLIDWLHEARDEADAVILNPGGLTHSSVSLADAVSALEKPVIEVHLSNIFAREAFRAHSTISRVAAGVITGLGTTGYLLAAQALAAQLFKQEEG
ncbi:type II 3-dehydroquinate dehydratase [Iodidimonas gelatinilytica]|uniref:type II 3-dehydroquinate dehydratase n=1 Tax=Iodidimonas gelatinilytica TaxID=1236966 RepID=UPI001B2FF17F|nr:type II 3-dehydroquinate dehydratase [Iodidimonas gelatinilytica]